MAKKKPNKTAQSHAEQQRLRMEERERMEQAELRESEDDVAWATFCKDAEPLINRARNGDVRAAGFLHSMASYITIGLNDAAKWHKAILSISRKSFLWPQMASRNEEIKKDNLAFLEAIQQGEDFVFANLPKGKKGKTWKFKRNETKLVFKYWLLIEPIRHFLNLEPLSAKESKDGGNWPKWAELAWQLVGKESKDGNPANHPMFYDDATKICNVRKTQTQKDFSNTALWSDEALYRDPKVTRKSPSIPKEDIKEAFFGAFEQIATGESRRTKQRKKRKVKKF